MSGDRLQSELGALRGLPVAPLPHPGESLPGRHHFSDDLRAATGNGPAPVKEVQPHSCACSPDQSALGTPGSADQELENDVAAGRPLTIWAIVNGRAELLPGKNHRPDLLTFV